MKPRWSKETSNNSVSEFVLGTLTFCSCQSQKCEMISIAQKKETASFANTEHILFQHFRQKKPLATRKFCFKISLVNEAGLICVYW